MALLDQVLLIINVFTLLFAFVTLIFIKRNREFERIELEGGLNALLFGMFFLFLMALISTLMSAEKVYHIVIVPYLPDAGLYVGYLQTITDLALIPLFAICFFVAVLMIRHALPREKKQQPESS